MNKRAQVSMEYLAVFSFVIMLTIPLILIYSVQTKNVQSDIANAQTYRILAKISDSAEEIYFQGVPAKKTIRISFPKGITSINVNSSYLEATFYDGATAITVTKATDAILKGSLRSFPGEHTITFTAEEDGVLLEDK
jgi:uncharacterized protein (UPF0333 family)